jgi:Xaa-Pro aminopeptidase
VRSNSEIEIKAERAASLARRLGLAGILLTTQHNFAWLTGGQSNRIDGSREAGAGALLIGANGRRFVLANTIESPRLMSEALVGFDAELREFPWEAERADAALVSRLAAEAVGGAIGADTSVPETRLVEDEIARARAPLVADELQRYSTLGRDVGRALGDTMRRLEPGGAEDEVARVVAAALIAVAARPIVLLVAGDDRIARFRHPVATSARWRHTLLVAVCAEREGLVVGLSRIVSAGKPRDEVRLKTRAAAQVFGALLEATQQGATGAAMYEAALRAYQVTGFPGQERLHHQGGPTGYRSREWIAHPSCTERASLPQAFAWNPSVTGTKVEETCIVHEDGRIENVTASDGWPAIAIEVRGQRVLVPDVLTLDR